MALDLSDTVRNAMLDAIETAIGTSAVLKIRTGAPPGIGSADSGTVLVTINLPSDWMAAASGGSKAKSGTWQDADADAGGTAAHFRIYASDGTTQHIEGTGTVTARWFDPTDGSYTADAASPLSNSGTHDFSRATANADGDADWILLLEA